MTNWVQDLGVVGVLSFALIFVLKYVTKTMSWEIKNIHDMIVKLIDKTNNLKETVDRLFNRNGK
tara:strand:- start:11486 stop:11677 length:192 start_codon:yes stop_codon:yes gene_type:complete